MGQKRCKDCDVIKSFDNFQKGSGYFGYKPQCKACVRERELRRREEDPLHAQLTIMADGILKRTKYVHCTPFNKSYKERNIQCLIGDNISEVRDALKKHYGYDVRKLLMKGEKPSVDRIDNYGHYELGNIQIIPLSENRRRVDMRSFEIPVTVFYKNGKTEKYRSIKTASEKLGINYSTFRRKCRSYEKLPQIDHIEYGGRGDDA